MYIGQKTNVKLQLLYLLQQTDIVYLSKSFSKVPPQKVYLSLKGVERSVNYLDETFSTVIITNQH